MKFWYIGIGALVALFPMASFVLIALEVIMVFQIAKSHDAVHIGDIIWFCSVMFVVSLFLKFLAAWLNLFPIIGQIANSVVAAGFIYFVYEVADAHYKKA
jgi:hypothetical protein